MLTPPQVKLLFITYWRSISPERVTARVDLCELDVKTISTPTYLSPFHIH